MIRLQDDRPSHLCIFVLAFDQVVVLLLADNLLTAYSQSCDTSAASVDATKESLLHLGVLDLLLQIQIHCVIVGHELIALKELNCGLV